MTNSRGNDSRNDSSRISKRSRQMTHPEDAENELASSNRFAGSRQMTEQPVGIKGAKDDDDDMNIEFEPNDI